MERTRPALGSIFGASIFAVMAARIIGDLIHHPCPDWLGLMVAGVSLILAYRFL